MFSSTNNLQNAQTARWVLITFFIVLFFVAVWLIRDILMLTLCSVILAVLLTTPVRFFVRLGIGRPLAVLLTLILLLFTLGIVIALILPGLLDQFARLLIAIRDTFANLQTQLENLAAWRVQAPNGSGGFEAYAQRLENSIKLAQQYPWLNSPFFKDLDFKSITDQIQGQLGNNLSNLFPVVGGLATTVGSFASVTLSILIVFFLALYFVADPNTHVNGIISLFPPRLRPRAREIFSLLDLTLRRYLQGQIILMIFSGVTTWIELALFRVPLAGALGTISGLFSFVPTFGPLVSLIPILAVALGTSGITPQTTALIVIIFFILQFIQSQVVTPVLMGQEVQLPPAVILLSQIIAGVFFGFLGLLLSVPLAAILVVLVREIYVKDILGDVPKGESVPQLDVSQV